MVRFQGPTLTVVPEALSFFFAVNETFSFQTDWPSRTRLTSISNRRWLGEIELRRGMR